MYGEFMTKNEIFSKWLPDSWSWTGQVREVIRASSLPSRVLASSSSPSGSVGSPSCLTSEVSKKLSSTPESMSTRSSSVWPFQLMVACDWVRGPGDRGVAAWLAMPLLASEPSGLTDGLGRWRDNDRTDHSRDRCYWLAAVHAPQR